MTYGFHALQEAAPVKKTSLPAQTAPATAVEQKPFAWPATGREGFVAIQPEQYTLRLTSDDGAIDKTMSWAELLQFPVTTEVQKIHSKAGWMTQGFWTTLSFQRLFTKLPPGADHYNWVMLTTLSGETMPLPKSRLSHYRLIYKCDDKILPPMYGGPVWVHCFDHYVEYGLSQLASITFLSKEPEQPHYHPRASLGFSPTAMRVQTGNYYQIHKEQIKHLRY